jgi:hypothetical protein
MPGNTETKLQVIPTYKTDKEGFFLLRLETVLGKLSNSFLLGLEEHVYK